MTDRDVRFVEKLSDESLRCRSMRHIWSLYYFGPLRGILIETKYSPYSPSVIVRQSICASCDTVREEFFNPPQGLRAMYGISFVPFKIRYTYPEDYRWRGGESSKEKPARGDYNYEMFLRVRRESNGRRAL